VTGPGRDTIFSRAYQYLPIRMDPLVADSAVARSVEARLRFFGTPAATEAAVRAVMDIPEYFLPVGRAEYAETGDLWLQREALHDADHTWWVLNPEGEQIARVTIPMGLDPRLIRGDELWGVELDELDVPYVVRYRILRGERS
jgi:hypothetical protein